MVTGRPKAELMLSRQEREQLQAMARSRAMPASLVSRAKVVLACASGASNREVARQLRLHAATVGKWRSRFIERRITGLHDELRPGKPRSIDDERVAELIRRTLSTKPRAGTHWSVRGMAVEAGLSKSAVQRLFKLVGLQPHRTKSFKLSTDAFFVEKLRDVVGLYLHPPDKAIVLSVDESVRCRRSIALSRCCRWDSVTLKASRMTTNGTAPPPCLPHSTYWTGQSSHSASRATGIRNFWPFCAISKPMSG